MVAWLVVAPVLWGLYLLLADKGNIYEISAGIVCASIAAAAAVLSGLAGRVKVAVEPRWVVRSLHAPWWIVRDSVLVSLSALRPTAPRGRFRALRFPPAGGEEPKDVGRRVMVKGPGSAGPNLYVIGGDAEAKLLLVHELLPRGDKSPLEIVQP